MTDLLSVPKAETSASCHLPMLGARQSGSLRTDDFHETPRIAVDSLLAVESFDGAIWEPACGHGAISDILLARGFEVVSTDLVSRGYGQGRVDFLMETSPLAPNIITNPPFKLAAEFADKAHVLAGGKVALLCRLGWLEGSARRMMFERTGLSRIWVFSKRLPMMHRHGYVGPKSTSAIAFAWFVWDRAHVGPPTLGWLP
jgi:hypothetical protein